MTTTEPEGLDPRSNPAPDRAAGPTAEPAPGSARAPVRRLGILGGSFDPVHVGHLHVARSAQAAFELDHVVFVPAARPPHKPGRQLAAGEHRTAMLELALAGRPDWSVDTLELERGGLSFTIDTVRALPERLAHLGLAPDCELFLLIGWDNLRGLERWREARALLSLVQPVVVYRAPAGAPDTPAARLRGASELLEHLRAELGDAVYARLERGFLPIEPVGVSSTAIRASFAAGEDPGETLGDVLPAGVGEYVRRAGLYGSADTP